MLRWRGEERGRGGWLWSLPRTGRSWRRSRSGSSTWLQLLLLRRSAVVWCGGLVGETQVSALRASRGGDEVVAEVWKQTRPPLRLLYNGKGCRCPVDRKRHRFPFRLASPRSISATSPLAWKRSDHSQAASSTQRARSGAETTVNEFAYTDYYTRSDLDQLDQPFWLLNFGQNGAWRRVASALLLCVILPKGTPAKE